MNARGAEVLFAVAGLEVMLRSQDADGLDTLSGFYDRYPSAGAAADLVIDVTRIDDFSEGRERGPGYPAFERSSTADGTIVVSRFDARGEIQLPAADDAPITAAFTVGRSSNTFEAAVRIGMSIALPRRGAFILHGSAIEFGGGAYLFAGISGAGKSTIAEMLAQSSDAYHKISDELVILAPGEHGWRAHVTPFMGSQGLPHGMAVPVVGMHFLEQARDHVRTPMEPTAAMRELMRHMLVYVVERRTADNVLSLAAGFSAVVPCYRLEFAKDPAVAGVLGIT